MTPIYMMIVNISHETMHKIFTDTDEKQEAILLMLPIPFSSLNYGPGLHIKDSPTEIRGLENKSRNPMQ